MNPWWIFLWISQGNAKSGGCSCSIHRYWTVGWCQRVQVWPVCASHVLWKYWWLLSCPSPKPGNWIVLCSWRQVVRYSVFLFQSCLIHVCNVGKYTWIQDCTKLVKWIANGSSGWCNMQDFVSGLLKEMETMLPHLFKGLWFGFIIIFPHIRYAKSWNLLNATKNTFNYKFLPGHQKGPKTKNCHKTLR